MNSKYLSSVIIVVVFLSLSAPLVVNAQPDSAYRAQTDDRIIEGQEVDGVIRKVPWILSLRKDGKHICAASFISPRMGGNGEVKSWSIEARNPVWAVTAAHCVVERNGTFIGVRDFSV